MLREDYGAEATDKEILDIELVWQLKKINRRMHETNAQLGRIADRLKTMGVH